MFVPGTKGSVSRLIGDDVVLIADAVGYNFEAKGAEYDESTSEMVALPQVKIKSRFPDWCEMTQGEMLQEVYTKVRTFVKNRENAEQYVQKHYHHLGGDAFARKVVEVKGRYARALEILGAIYAEM